MNIGILILATNAYFPLGLRLVNRFHHYYNGDANITFYFCSNRKPDVYLKEEINVKHIVNKHKSWLEGTNSKFKNILSLEDEDLDYIFYMDSDTNVFNPFDEQWMLGESVAAQHFDDKTRMKNVKCYDRNPKSKAYVPLDTKLPEMYYHGAFFGGTKARMMEICKVLRSWQIEDDKIKYEPSVNDESYINAFFHYNPPTTVLPYSDFQFSASDGGGLLDKRNNPSVAHLTRVIVQYKNKLWDIKDNRIAIL